MLESPRDQELQASSRSGGQPPADGQEPARSWDPLSSNHKEMSSANNPSESGSGFFPSESTDENTACPTL